MGWKDGRHGGMRPVQGPVPGTRDRQCRRGPGMSALQPVFIFFFPNKKIPRWILGIVSEEGYRESWGVKGRQESSSYTRPSLRSQKHRCLEYHLLELRPAFFLCAFLARASRPGVARHSRHTAWPAPSLLSQSSTRGTNVRRAPVCWALRVLAHSQSSHGPWGRDLHPRASDEEAGLWEK